MKVSGAWYAFRTIAEIEGIHSLVTIATWTFKFKCPLLKISDHQSLIASVTMTTQL